MVNLVADERKEVVCTDNLLLSEEALEGWEPG